VVSVAQMANKAIIVAPKGKCNPPQEVLEMTKRSLAKRKRKDKFLNF